jgi:CcmD family protein
VKHFGSVVAAYMVIWGVFMLYDFTLARRMSSLRDEIDRLKNMIGKSPRF